MNLILLLLVLLRLPVVQSANPIALVNAAKSAPADTLTTNLSSINQKAIN